MVYTVKAKKNLEELIEILEEEGISLSYQDTYSFTILSDNDKDFDIFTNVLSFYVSYINFEEVLLSNFLKKGVTQKEAEIMTENSLYDFTNSHYFYAFVRILVKEYFKKMKTFNVESFSLFNMRGFKEEVKQFVDTTLQIHNEHNNQTQVEGYDFIPEKGGISQAGINEVFGVLRERGIENGLKMENFKELHIHQQAEGIQFQNQYGTILNDDFFLDFLGSALEFEIVDKMENPELFESMMISSVLINIFDVKKVIVHQSVSKKAEEILLYNFTSLKKETGRRMKVVMCNGCEHCE